MSQLDETVIESPDAAELSRPALSPRQAVRTKRRLLFVGVVLVGALGFLLFKGLSSAIVYFKTAQQAVADRTVLGNSVFQIEGVVVPGSVRHKSIDTTSFAISSGKVTVQVLNSGVPPQLFAADIPVVLVGHFVGSSNVFSSDQILVKHSNQYIAAHPSRVTAPNGSVR